MKIRVGSRIAVFLLSLAVWCLITSFSDPQEIGIGVVIALLVAVIAGDLLAPRGVRLNLWTIPRLLLYLAFLIWEIFQANLQVAYIVLHPRLPIRPGIVKIKTSLASEAALTMLANSITLTPGTFTVDIDQEKGFLYVHCIQVPGGDLEANTAAIGAKFERRLREIFQ